ncbi:MAG TPA: hypothetical protein ENI05_01285 [Porticoccus sp.]|nr:hypothetical protein [Porticoccus sp.]
MSTSKVLMTPDTALVFAKSGYTGGTNRTLGAQTHLLDMIGLTTGQARAATKADLGASHAEEYSVDMEMEMATDPVDGETWDIYWYESHIVTAAVGNLGGTTGVDADYAGYDTLTLAMSLRHLIFIGSFVMGENNTADGVQIGHVGFFSPTERWGGIVAHNNTSDTSFATDSNEMAIRIRPRVPDIQAAA